MCIRFPFRDFVVSTRGEDQRESAREGERGCPRATRARFSPAETRAPAVQSGRAAHQIRRYIQKRKRGVPHVLHSSRHLENNFHLILRRFRLALPNR